MTDVCVRALRPQRLNQEKGQEMREESRQSFIEELPMELSFDNERISLEDGP